MTVNPAPWDDLSRLSSRVFTGMLAAFAGLLGLVLTVLFLIGAISGLVDHPLDLPLVGACVGLAALPALTVLVGRAAARHFGAVGQDLMRRTSGVLLVVDALLVGVLLTNVHPI